LVENLAVYLQPAGKSSRPKSGTIPPSPPM
jgi:hypothetical protein